MAENNIPPFVTMNVSLLPSPIPLPGKIIVHDFRPKSLADISENPPRDSERDTLRVIQWNVERNYKQDLILAELESVQPDIVILQEVDIFCERSGNRDHFREICERMHMLGAFVVEFWELSSATRRYRDQGGGLHGNAILTRYDAVYRVLEHKNNPFNWERDGHLLREPRRGQRYTLVAEITPPEQIHRGPPLLAYCVHLEVFCGIIGRIGQFSDVLKDSHDNVQKRPHQIIFGDLNTMAHGIARLSPVYCNDIFRILSLGWSETEWWDRNLFAWNTRHGDWNLRLLTGGSFLMHSIIKIIGHFWKPQYSPPFSPFFNPFILHQARNPFFYDPFPINTITLHNSSYMGLYRAKLDWTLLRCLGAQGCIIGNHDYAASDHKWLCVDISFDNIKGLDEKAVLEIWERRRREVAKKQSHSYEKWSMVILIGVFGVFGSLGHSMFQRRVSRLR